jgi:hypothetical protein
MMQGIVILLIKQYGGVSTFCIKCSLEFLYMNSYFFNSTLQTMWGVATLHIKKYGEYRLSAINDSGESIKKKMNISSNSKLYSKSLQIPSKRLGRSPFLKKSEAANLVGLPF